MLFHVLEHLCERGLQSVGETCGVDQSAQCASGVVVHADGHHRIGGWFHGSQTEVDASPGPLSIRVDNDSASTVIVILGCEAVAHGALAARGFDTQLVLAIGAAHGSERPLQNNVVVLGFANPVEHIFAPDSGEENVLGDDRHTGKSNMLGACLVRASHARPDSVF